jgi:putative zinc finger protein
MGAGAGERCPDLEVVNAVLDREATEEVAAVLRRHVASCERCNESFGALFEVDALAPAIVRDGASLVHLGVARRRRVGWPRALFAAAALIVAAAFVVLLRPRGGSAPEVVTLPPTPAAPAPEAPRLVASRVIETEIVVDGAGVHGSIRRRGDGDPGSFEFERRRGGGASICWSRLPPSSPDTKELPVPPVEKPR